MAPLGGPGAPGIDLKSFLEEGVYYGDLYFVSVVIFILRGERGQLFGPRAPWGPQVGPRGPGNPGDPQGPPGNPGELVAWKHAGIGSLEASNPLVGWKQATIGWLEARNPLVGSIP